MSVIVFAIIDFNTMTKKSRIVLAALLTFSSIYGVQAKEEDSVYQEAYQGKSQAYINASEKYAETVSKSIRKKWRPSHIKGIHNISVLYTINKNGTLKDVSIASSNAPEQLNQDSIDAVVAASPFDPLPGVLGDEFVMEFTFHYKRNWK